MDSPSGTRSPDKTRAVPHDKNQHASPSKSDIIASAKAVAEALRPGAEIDKRKVAGAGADLLHAASHYGKLEDKRVGKYVQKAEDYLHHYHSATTTTTTSSSSSGHSATATATTTTTSTHSSSHPDDGKDKHSGSGYGEYIKMAQDLLKKR